MKNNTIKIHNESCIDTMNKMDKESIDVILTSPFYNTNKRTRGKRTLMNTECKGYTELRYDTVLDDMTNEEYCDFTNKLFTGFDKVLKPNGVILYNLSYGSENTEGMFLTIAEIINNTNFTIADVIIWKKKTALPNNTSHNKLTRIVEYVFVICRKSEIKTFKCNKPKKAKGKTGQQFYENVYNFVEAKNNDGSCPYNKATYSSELCEKLLTLYAPNNGCVYDPFMGTGTTGKACQKMNLQCIGSEISENQVKWAIDRLGLNEIWEDDL